MTNKTVINSDFPNINLSISEHLLWIHPKCSDFCFYSYLFLISYNFWWKSTIWTCFCKIGWNWTGNWTVFTHSYPLVRLGLLQNTLNFRKKLEKFWRRSEKIFYFFLSFKIQNVYKRWYDAIHGRPISVQFTVQFCPGSSNCNFTLITTRP